MIHAGAIQVDGTDEKAVEDAEARLKSSNPQRRFIEPEYESCA